MAIPRGRRRAGPDLAPAAGAPSYLVTYGTLMTLLLAFFVMLYARGGASAGSEPAGSGQKPAVRQEASLSAIQRQLTAEIGQAGAGQSVGLIPDDGQLVIRFDASLLFVSGRADLKPEGIPALDAIGRVLSGVGNRIRIEGHTDSDPMIPNPQYPDNWMLSGARATGVLRYLHEFHGVPFSQISIAGYADTRPVASNETPAGKAKNRRVDIVVLGR